MRTYQQNAPVLLRYLKNCGGEFSHARAECQGEIPAAKNCLACSEEISYYARVIWGRHGFDGGRGIEGRMSRLSGTSLNIRANHLNADNYAYAVAA